MSSVVELEIRDGVAWVALNRPEKLNAIDDDVLEGLIAAVARVDREDGIGAAVLHTYDQAVSQGGGERYVPELVSLLKERDKTVATAESCTGGLVSGALSVRRCRRLRRPRTSNKSAKSQPTPMERVNAAGDRP